MWSSLQQVVRLMTTSQGKPSSIVTLVDALSQQSLAFTVGCWGTDIFLPYYGFAQFEPHWGLCDLSTEVRSFVTFHRRQRQSSLTPGIGCAVHMAKAFHLAFGAACGSFHPAE
jgi:hypothetical protein